MYILLQISVLIANIASTHDVRTSPEATCGRALRRRDRDAVSEETGIAWAIGFWGCLAVRAIGSRTRGASWTNAGCGSDGEWVSWMPERSEETEEDFEERLLSIWLAGWGFGQVSTSNTVMVVYSSFSHNFHDSHPKTHVESLKTGDWRQET